MVLVGSWLRIHFLGLKRYTNNMWPKGLHKIDNWPRPHKKLAVKCFLKNALKNMD